MRWLGDKWAKVQCLMNKYFTITRCKTNQEIELTIEFEISLLGLYDFGGWYFFYHVAVPLD